MSYQSVISNIDKRIAVIESGLPMLRAVRSVMAVQHSRIFEEGKSSAGGAIGSYNDKDELYVNPSTLPRAVSPRGKPGKSKNIQNRKTVYFKSYEDLRSEVGRESGFVNIRLSGDLQSDFANASLTSDVIKAPEPVKISNLEYHVTLKRDINIKKKAGLEKKYGPIFKLTEREKTFYFDVLRKEILLIDA